MAFTIQGYQVTQAVFNTVTYNNATGGILDVTYDINGTDLIDGTGADVYAQAVEVADLVCAVQIRMRETKWTLAPSTTSNLVITVKLKGGGTDTLTFANMVYMGISGSQPRSEWGDATLRFVHESADGSTYPLS